MRAPLAVNQLDRVLVVRLSHWGDVLCGLPAVRHLRRALPAQCEIAWVIQPEFATLLESEGTVSRIIPFERRAGLSGWLRCVREIRRFAPQVTLDLQANSKSAALAWCSGARQRLAPHPSGWQEPWARWLSNRRPAGPAPLHVLDRGMDLVAWALNEQRIVPELGLAVTAEERESGEQLLTHWLPDRGRPRRILHAGREGDPRSLDRTQLSALISRLREEEDLLVLTGPAEADLGTHLSGTHAPGEDLKHWIGQRGPRELAAFFRAAGAAGVRYCGGDSGPMHLAALSGIPTDIWFGPTEPARSGPWPPVGSANSPHRAHLATGGRLREYPGRDLAESILSSGRGTALVR